MSESHHELRAVAPLLDGLRPDSAARVGYDWYAGGLAWSDETPHPDEVEAPGLIPRLRAVWRFRSSLIAGTPDERYRPNWDAARQLFPNWPGFLPDRQDPKWLPLLRELEAKADEQCEDLDRRLTAATRPSPVSPAVSHQETKPGHHTA